MIRTSFNRGWTFRSKVNSFAELAGQAPPYEPVILPHDAMITRPRLRPDGSDVTEGSATAYFPSGAYEYSKTFFVPKEHESKRILVEFEGVYRDAVVSVNGNFAGHRPYGYSQFLIDVGRFLSFGADNTIRVEARTSQDSRWYSGAGIYRDTWMLLGEVVHIEPDGVRVATPDIEPDRAVVEVATTVANDSITIRTVDVLTEVIGPHGAAVSSDNSRVTIAPGDPAIVRQRLCLPRPLLWSPDSPKLYRCLVSLTATGGDVDREQVTFGVRRLQLDPDRGLRVNGETVKLRGACIHHDNGPLGAATFGRAEERRVQLLKDAGFNAIRMAHHPMSKAMLDACDRLGMFVMDEAFDMWAVGKNPFDYSLSFPDWWERDIEAMVTKDHNHPSVILYSTGNEIPEVASASGAVIGRKLAEKIRSADGSRYVTNGINNLLAVASDRDALRQELQRTVDESTGMNTFMADMGEAMNQASASRLVTDRTAEAYSILDVAGMNYSDSRYALDKDLFPNRVIVGTETFPTRIDRNWELVTIYSHVIGDFTWTGWDYLGEVGIGWPRHAEPESATGGMIAPYPHLVAGCGDIDIIGDRRPASYYREIVFGRRSEPYLAVQRPEHHGQAFAGSPWAWSHSLSSWTWPGFEGAPITVEVYSDADEVELLVNGRSLGRLPAGRHHRFRTEFETSYEPGELLAVAYRGGTKTGRSHLRTAGLPPVVRAAADRPMITTRHGDLAYVTITLTDPEGTVNPSADRLVRVDVSGDGTLLAFGSADPATEETFNATQRRTYHGRALCIISPTGPGQVRLAASAAGCNPAEVLIVVEEDPTYTEAGLGS
jgi:beta-galactosidase